MVRRFSKARHRSGLEDRVADQLKEAGMPYKYEAVTFDIVTVLAKNRIRCADCGCKNVLQDRRYTPDFFLDNGIIIEAKGIFTADNRKVIEAFIEQYPDKDFRMLFSKDNPLRKGSSTRYSDWCKSKGIKYAFKEVPEEWLQL